MSEQQKKDTGYDKDRKDSNKKTKLSNKNNINGNNNSNNDNINNNNNNNMQGHFESWENRNNDNFSQLNTNIASFTMASFNSPDNTSILDNNTPLPAVLNHETPVRLNIPIEHNYTRVDGVFINTIALHATIYTLLPKPFYISFD